MCERYTIRGGTMTSLISQSQSGSASIRKRCLRSVFRSCPAVLDRRRNVPTTTFVVGTWKFPEDLKDLEGEIVETISTRNAASTSKGNNGASRERERDGGRGRDAIRRPANGWREVGIKPMKNGGIEEQEERKGRKTVTESWTTTAEIFIRCTSSRRPFRRLSFSLAARARPARVLLFPFYRIRFVRAVYAPFTPGESTARFNYSCTSRSEG